MALTQIKPKTFTINELLVGEGRQRRTAPCLDASCPVIALSGKAKDAPMGINSEREIEANLQIGPTDQGMVRIFVDANGVEIPMDFTPEEALEIAEEIAAAAKVIG
jgi:hypothetical protein